MKSMRRCWLAALAAVLATMHLRTGLAAEPLIMGVFPRVDAIETNRMLQPLAQHLSAAIGQPVVLETTKDFEAFSKALADKRYDLVHLNQYHYLKAYKDHGYIVIARNVEQGGDTIAAALFVRTDSAIKDLAQLKGKKVTFGGDRTAMQAYIGATYLLRQAGLKQGDYEEQFAKSPGNAVLAAFYKQTDAAGAGDILVKLPSVAKQMDLSQIRILAAGESLPHLPWAVKKSMPRDVRTKIQLAMVTLGKSDEGKLLLKRAGYDGFTIASNADYDKHRAIVRIVLGEKY